MGKHRGFMAVKWLNDENSSDLVIWIGYMNQQECWYWWYKLWKMGRSTSNNGYTPKNEAFPCWISGAGLAVIPDHIRRGMDISYLCFAVSRIPGSCHHTQTCQKTLGKWRSNDRTYLFFLDLNAMWCAQSTTSVMYASSLSAVCVVTVLWLCCSQLNPSYLCSVACMIATLSKSNLKFSRITVSITPCGIQPLKNWGRINGRPSITWRTRSEVERNISQTGHIPHQATQNVLFQMAGR